MGEENVDEVGEEERPCDGDSAEEEEGCEEKGDGEGVAEDDKGLEAALEGDGERGEVDAGGDKWLAGSMEKRGRRGRTGSSPSQSRPFFHSEAPRAAFLGAIYAFASPGRMEAGHSSGVRHPCLDTSQQRLWSSPSPWTCHSYAMNCSSYAPFSRGFLGHRLRLGRHIELARSGLSSAQCLDSLLLH